MRTWSPSDEEESVLGTCCEYRFRPCRRTPRAYGRDVTLGSCRKQALEQLGTVEGLDVPSRLRTMMGSSSLLSKVVKRVPHSRHSRLRLMLAPSSNERESITGILYSCSWGQSIRSPHFASELSSEVILSENDGPWPSLRWHPVQTPRDHMNEKANSATAPSADATHANACSREPFKKPDARVRRGRHAHPRRSRCH